MDLTLVTPAPAPALATYRLTSTHYEMLSGMLSIAYQTVDTTGAASITKVDILNSTQTLAFLGTVATAGQTLQEVFIAAAVAYIQSAYGAVTITSQ